MLVRFLTCCLDPFLVSPDVHKDRGAFSVCAFGTGIRCNSNQGIFKFRQRWLKQQWTSIISTQTPIFVIVTWDDAFTREEFRQHISKLLHENRDVRDYCGGSPRHTFFVSNDHTDYAAMGHMLNFGSEYALHSVHHQDVTPTKAYWNKQIKAGMQWAERLVPSEIVFLEFLKRCVMSGLKEKVEWRPVGFRAPWLEHSETLYEATQEFDQIVYDSSLPSFKQPFSDL